MTSSKFRKVGAALVGGSTALEEAMAGISSSLGAKIASSAQLTPDEVSTALKGANSSVQDELQ